MKIFKKNFVLGLLIVLSFFLIASPFSNLKTQAKETITAWHTGTSAAQKAPLEYAKKKFEKNHPNIKLKLVAMTDEAYKTKLKVAGTGGKLPDMFITWAGGRMETYVDAGRLVDLTPKLKESGLDEKIAEATLNAATYEGKTWAVAPTGAAAVAFWYNKDVFEKYNISVPSTFSELKEAASKLKSEGVIPFSLANSTRWPGTEWYEYLVYRLGGRDEYEEAQKEDSDVDFTNEVFIKAGQMLQELVRKDYFNQGFNSLSYGQGQSRALVYTGRAAMELMGNWWYTQAKSEVPEFAEESLGMFSFPRIEGVEGADPTTIVGSPGGGNFWSISKSCGNVEAAFDFLKILTEKKITELNLEGGKLPTIKGRENLIENPVNKKVYELITEASYVKDYWNVAMEPEIYQVHMDATQAMLDLSITPEEYGRRMQKAVEDFYSD